MARASSRSTGGDELFKKGRGHYATDNNRIPGYGRTSSWRNRAVMTRRGTSGGRQGHYTYNTPQGPSGYTVLCRRKKKKSDHKIQKHNTAPEFRCTLVQ